MYRFPNSTIVLFNTTGLNFNSTADQAIPIIVGDVNSYLIRGIRIYLTSRALATAVGGIYNNTGKPAGGKIVGDAQAYSAVTAAGEGMSPTITSFGQGVRTSQTLYLSLTTGGILIWGTPLS